MGNLKWLKSINFLIEEHFHKLSQDDTEFGSKKSFKINNFLLHRNIYLQNWKKVWIQMKIDTSFVFLFSVTKFLVSEIRRKV